MEVGYRKVDPRTKAAAVKAMRKMVDAGEPAAAAARELATRYNLSATTLQKYYTEATAEVAESTAPDSVVAPDAAAEAETEAAVDAVPPGDSRDGTLAVYIDASTPQSHDTASSMAAADAFTDQVQAASEAFVRQLQVAALDDLIRKMESVRSQLQTQ